jgi:hypothetical protein
MQSGPTQSVAITVVPWTCSVPTRWQIGIDITRPCDFERTWPVSKEFLESAAMAVVCRQRVHQPNSRSAPPKQQGFEKNKQSSKRSCCSRTLPHEPLLYHALQPRGSHYGRQEFDLVLFAVRARLRQTAHHHAMLISEGGAPGFRHSTGSAADLYHSKPPTDVTWRGNEVDTAP